MIIKIQNKPVLLLNIFISKHNKFEFIFEILIENQINYVSSIYGWITGIYTERFKTWEYINLLKIKDKDQINHLFEKHNNGIFNDLKL